MEFELMAQLLARTWGSAQIFVGRRCLATFLSDQEFAVDQQQRRGGVGGDARVTGEVVLSRMRSPACQRCHWSAASTSATSSGDEIAAASTSASASGLCPRCHIASRCRATAAADRVGPAGLFMVAL